jgi:hypothetical protein
MLVACGGAPPRESQCAAAAAPAAAPAPGAALATDDPAKTDPDKYKVVLENDRVRVLRYHDKPGDKTTAHHHPDSVLYALSTFRRRLTFPDGKTKELSLTAGDVMWLPAQGHIGENIGTTDTEVLLVEPRR